MNRIFHYLCISTLVSSGLIAAEVVPDEIRIFPEGFGKPDSLRIKKLLAQKGIQQQVMVMVGGISDSQKDTVFFLDMNGMQQLPLEEKEHALVFGYEDTASLALSGCMNRYSLMTDLVFRREKTKHVDTFLGLENFTRSPELREAWYRLSQKKNFSGKRLFWVIDRQIQQFKKISLEEWLEENPDANPADYYNFTIPEMAQFCQLMDQNFSIIQCVPEENTLDNWRNLYRDLFFATMLILPENERLNFKESYDFFRAEQPTTFAVAYLPFFNMMMNWRLHRISKVIQAHYLNAQRYHVPFYVMIEEPYINILRKKLAAEELTTNVIDYRSIIKIWGTAQEKELLNAPHYTQQKKIKDNHQGSTMSSYQRTISMKDQPDVLPEKKSASADEVIQALQKIQPAQPATDTANTLKDSDTLKKSNTKGTANPTTPSTAGYNDLFAQNNSETAHPNNIENTQKPEAEKELAAKKEQDSKVTTPKQTPGVKAQVVPKSTEIDPSQEEELDEGIYFNSPSTETADEPVPAQPPTTTQDNEPESIIEVALSQLGETPETFQELSEIPKKPTTGAPEAWWFDFSDENAGSTAHSSYASHIKDLSSSPKHARSMTNPEAKATATQSKASTTDQSESYTTTARTHTSTNAAWERMSGSDDESEKDSKEESTQSATEALQKAVPKVASQPPVAITYGADPKAASRSWVEPQSKDEDDEYSEENTPPSDAPILQRHPISRNNDYQVPVVIAHDSDSTEDLTPATVEEIEIIQAEKLGEDCATFDRVSEENDDSVDFDNVLLMLGPNDEMTTFASDPNDITYVDPSVEEHATMDTQYIPDVATQNSSSASTTSRTRP